MATITVIEGVGTYPALASANGAATGNFTDLDTGTSANSWAASPGDVLVVLNDAASTGDSGTVSIEGQTNPYGVQADKAKAVDGMAFTIFTFETLTGWATGSGAIEVSVTENGTGSMKAVVYRPYNG